MSGNLFRRYPDLHVHPLPIPRDPTASPESDLSFSLRPFSRATVTTNTRSRPGVAIRTTHSKAPIEYSLPSRPRRYRRSSAGSAWSAATAQAGWKKVETWVKRVFFFFFFAARASVHRWCATPETHPAYRGIISHGRKRYRGRILPATIRGLKFVNSFG